MYCWLTNIEFQALSLVSEHTHFLCKYITAFLSLEALGSTLALQLGAT